MSIFFGFIRFVLSIYMLLITLRILLTWFHGLSYGRIQEFLSTVTDPYLNWFQRHTPIRIAHLDFSPMIGILVLGFCTSIANRIAREGYITLRFILQIFISTLWSFLSFFLFLILILAMVELLGSIFDKNNKLAHVWTSIDYLVNPFIRLFFKSAHKFKIHRNALAALVMLLAGLLIAGRILTQILTFFIQSIPF